MSTVPVAIERMPANDRELWHFVRAVFGVTIPNTKVCPNHVPPFRAFADAYFARYPVMIWKGSRGLAGKSWTLATLANTMVVGLAAQTTILGGSGAQSLNVHLASKAAWDYPHAPRSLLAGTPTKYDSHYTNGAWVRSLMASQTSVRGPHPQRLLLDEIDEMDLDVLEGAQGQPMRGRHGNQAGLETCTVMSSTHQYATGTMTEMLLRAKDRHWPVYEFCYRETANPYDGWLTMDEVERKRAEIPRHMWETEYELGEPAIEGRALDSSAVERCFFGPVLEVDSWTDLDHQDLLGDKKLRLTHVTGVDWAKENDKTVITTFSVESNGVWRCVAWASMNKKPWPTMIAQAEERLRTYGPAFGHDATGLGNVIADYFDPDLRRRYQRYFADVIMGSGRTRQDLFANYISAIENDRVRYPRIASLYRDHLYVTWDDLFGAGHPPDSFVAGAIAWKLRDQIAGGLSVSPLEFLK